MVRQVAGGTAGVTMPSLEDAIALAVESHRGQKDKAGEPYILHPLRVMLRLVWDGPEPAKIASSGRYA